MPSSLATIRARLQIVLDDAGAAFWTTAELDEHIQRALSDLSHHIPLEKKTTLATVNADRDLDISSLTARVRVKAVEYKTGNWPRTFQPFTIWEDTLTFTGDTVPDGANADIYWHALHTINGANTLPDDHEEILIFGAAARACRQQQAETTDQLTTGGPGTERNWGALAAHYQAEYETRLHRRRGIGQHRTYAPTEPLPTQDSDPGP